MFFAEVWKFSNYLNDVNLPKHTAYLSLFYKSMLCCTYKLFSAYYSMPLCDSHSSPNSILIVKSSIENQIVFQYA
jgi:hypothetical protein